MWLGSIGENAYLASPTDDGLFLAAVVPPIERWEELRADRERHYDEGLEGWPELRDHIGAAKRVGPVRMMSRWHGFFRESAGPGLGAGRRRRPLQGPDSRAGDRRRAAPGGRAVGRDREGARRRRRPDASCAMVGVARPRRLGDVLVRAGNGEHGPSAAGGPGRRRAAGPRPAHGRRPAAGAQPRTPAVRAPQPALGLSAPSPRSPASAGGDGRSSARRGPSSAISCAAESRPHCRNR